MKKIKSKLNIRNNSSMRKVIAAINVTINGFCDHTSGIPDDEIHRHYADLLQKGDVILYGRKTFQLMEYWRTIINQPSDDDSMNAFANAIDNIHKIVFSHTLTSIDWESAKLATQSPEKVIRKLRQQPGKDIFIGSPGLISSLTEAK